MKTDNKKLQKRVLSLALALSLAFSLGVTAYAYQIDSNWTGDYSTGTINYVDPQSASGTLSIPDKYENEDGKTVYVHYCLSSFYGNTNITSVSTNAPLYRFPYFSHCTALQSVEIPTSVATSFIFYDGIFSGCTSLKNVNFKDVHNPDAEDETASEVRGIGYEMFEDCSSLQSIDIPDTVGAIYNDAFSGCTSLADFSFPEKLTYIGERAFENCSALNSISLPSSLLKIDKEAFWGCSLESVTIPASVERIYEHAFSNNPELNSITFLSDDSAKTLVALDQYEYFDNDPFKIAGVSNSTRTIYGPAGGAVEKFARHWGYNFNSAPAEEEGFTMGVDSYSFSNNQSSFPAGEGGNAISDEHFQMLTANYPQTYIARAKEYLTEPYSGMCFGMSSSALLFYERALSQAGVQNGATTTYSLYAPVQNQALRELLAFYQVSWLFVGNTNYSTTNETPNNLALVSALKSGSDPVVFCATIDGAFYHAMVAYDMDEEDGDYVISVYDPNHPEYPLDLYISKDGTTSDFEDAYSSVYIKDIYRKSDLSNSAFQSHVAANGLLTLTTNFDSMTITAGGETATIVDGVQTGGDLQVNCLGPKNEEDETRIVEFSFIYDYSDGGLTVTPVSGSNDGDGYEATLLTDDADDGSYISVSTDNDAEITVKQGGGVSATGKTRGRFKVSSTSDNTDGQLYTITAEGTDTGVTVTPDQNGGTVVTENDTPVDVTVGGATDAVTFDDIDSSSEGVDITTDGNSVTVTDGESGETLAKGVATDEENEFLEGFIPVQEYQNGLFSDVKEGEWYDASVELAYQLGIINGTGDGKFNPNGDVTVAQAIKMACIVHSVYTGDNADFTQGDLWYQVYVDYAIQNGIIQAGQFDSYTDSATRAEMAAIFANGISSSELDAINNVKSIPDVSESDEYGSQIYLLYRAGVLTGNDTSGTFGPSSSISRAQAAAIITRIVVVNQRRSLAF